MFSSFSLSSYVEKVVKEEGLLENGESGGRGDMKVDN